MDEHQSVGHENIEQILDFEIPENLYVPTPPLWIESKGFRGPLDLLWYLIRKQNIDILDIPVALIAAQYVQYLKMMNVHRFEIAPDYLLMAVRLLQIKSQMMLPKPPTEEAHEEDPRALLVKQLTDYEIIQHAAHFLDDRPRWNRDVWPVKVSLSEELPPPPLPDATFVELIHAYQQVVKKKGFQKEHEVERPKMTLSDRMLAIYESLEMHVPKPFHRVCSHPSERLDIAISFQAILELSKSKQIDLSQAEWNDLLWLNRIS
jgi:segregation and condensation protein A